MLLKLLHITGVAFATVVTLLMLLSVLVLVFYWDGALAFLIGE